MPGSSMLANTACAGFMPSAWFTSSTPSRTKTAPPRPPCARRSGSSTAISRPIVARPPRNARPSLWQSSIASSPAKLASSPSTAYSPGCMPTRRSCSRCSIGPRFRCTPTARKTTSAATSPDAKSQAAPAAISAETVATPSSPSPRPAPSSASLFGITSGTAHHPWRSYHLAASPVGPRPSQTALTATSFAPLTKYPGKPWKYLLLDHHHIDHIGGLRAFAAAGATIVVGKGDGAFYRKVLSAPETLNPYGTKQVPPKVEEVDGKWSATEGGRTINAYSLDNPHSTGYIIPYIPDAKLGFVTDIWSPAPQIPPANPGTTALVKGIQKMGIQMDRMAGGHGGVGNFADLAKTVQ